jgi:hypothetical protein
MYHRPWKSILMSVSGWLVEFAVEARPVGVDGGEEVLDVPNFGQWASFWHLPLQFALTHFLVHLFSLFV